MLDDLNKTAKEKMDMVLNVVRDEFATVRTGRASVTLLEKIKVPCYGSVMPLNQVATINVPDPHQIIIQPWDKTIMQDIEKAVLSSDLKLNPVKDGNIIRISVPSLSTERREELIKVVGKKSEEGKVAIRNLRREMNDRIKKMDDDGKVAEDEARKAQDKIQKMTDVYIVEIDNMAKNKENEIRQV